MDKSGENSEKQRLLKEIRALDAEIARLGDAQTLRKQQMDLLHQYNDTKDATQTIIGKLAEAKMTTIKAIHKKYGLPLDD